jgi:hypothetical protein
MKVVSDDGEEMEYGPGDFAIMAPGHDAWIVGDESCVVIDWQGLRNTRSPNPSNGFLFYSSGLVPLAVKRYAGAR